MWKFELKRILINKKGLAVIFFGILLECISMIGSASFRCESIIENNKELYEEYLDIYGGKVSQEKSDSLDKEIERLEQKQQAASDITDAYLAGKATAAEVSAAAAEAYPYQIDIKILQYLRQQMDYAMCSKADTIIYENGWIMLLGRSHINYVIPVLLILLFLPSVTENFECGMDKMVSCCRKGRARLYMDKMTAMLVVSFFVCVVNVVIEVLYFRWKYGLDHWMLPIKNIATFENLPVNLPLALHLMVKVLQWGMGCVFLSCLILAAGVIIKNTFNGILFLLIFTIAPAVFLEKEVLFHFFLPVSFFTDGGYFNGVEVLQDKLMVLPCKSVWQGMLCVLVVLIICLGVSRFLMNKKKNVKLLGIFFCCFFLFGCKRTNIDQDKVYVGNRQTEEIEVNGYHISYDIEFMDYVIEIDGQKIPLNNDPLRKISGGASSTFDLMVYQNMIYYVVSVSIGGEFWYEICELDTDTMKKEVVYTTKPDEASYSKISVKMNHRIFSQFHLLLAIDEVLIYSDTQGVYLYDRKNETEKNILPYAECMGVCDGELYYIDRIGYLNAYSLETEKSRKVMEGIISGYVFAKGGIVYVDTLDLKVKLYKNQMSIVLFEDEVQYIFLDGEKIKCVTYKGEEKVID